MKKHRALATPSKLLWGLVNPNRPSWADKYKSAIAGDMQAVKWLHFEKPSRDDQLNLLISLCKDSAPVSMVRRLLLDILMVNPVGIRPSTPGASSLLRELLLYASFPIPDDLPSSFTVWRGTAGVSIDTAASGYFWSTDRDYAMQYAINESLKRKCEPLLVRAEVSRSEISALLNVTFETIVNDPTLTDVGFTNEMQSDESEKEVLIVHPPENVSVDHYPVFSENLMNRLRHQIWVHKAMTKNHEAAKAQAKKQVRQNMADVGWM